MPKNKEIKFCKIDVEGSERNVLLGYDFINYRPKVFCVESTIPAILIPCHDLFEDILLKNDYSFAYQYKINRYYIDNRVTGLREKFFKVEKNIEIFIKNKNKTNIYTYFSGNKHIQQWVYLKREGFSKNKKIF